MATYGHLGQYLTLVALIILPLILAGYIRLVISIFVISASPSAASLVSVYSRRKKISQKFLSAVMEIESINVVLYKFYVMLELK